MSYRILVCGSRDYTNRDKLFRVLDRYLLRFGDDLFIISGGAPGADRFAQQWAVSRRVDHLISYARWETEGKSAGPNRNLRQIKRGKPHLVLAFSTHFDTSKGTNDMLRVAKKRGVKDRKFS